LIGSILCGTSGRRSGAATWSADKPAGGDEFSTGDGNSMFTLSPASVCVVCR
jgi:hypothetical protein